MAISSSQAAKINKMNRASQDVSLGTIIKNQQTYIGVSGSAVVSAVSTNASALTINTGLGSVKGFLIQAWRAGSPVLGGYAVSNSGSIIYRANAAGSALLTLNDYVDYIAW
jgi:hypothetical protein